MTQEEINTYVMTLPYGAMGDFFVFREEEHKESHYVGVSKVYD